MITPKTPWAPKTPWERAQTALALLLIDPVGLGGMTVKARVGPARDAFVQMVKNRAPRLSKLHAAMGKDALDGSIDITATLDAGQIIEHKGLLTRKDDLFLLSMAERAEPLLAARLSIALDAGDMRGLIALDEGAEDDEALPAALADRLAFQSALDDVSMADITASDAPPLNPALRAIDSPAELPEHLIVLAVQLGIHSLRAPSFALRAAKAHAALCGRTQVETQDVSVAVELVYAHRATMLPQQDDTPPPEPDQPDAPPPDQQSTETPMIPEDMLLEAVLSALPEGLLDRLNGAKTKGGKGAGSGKKIIGNRRGRPLPARDGTAKPGTRIDLMATLRAAVPMQTIRKAAQPDRKGPIFRPSDLRSKRYQDLSDRVLIFAVDASGSAAFARLGEAKGAIEILLAEAYSRRDHAALISFRGTEAEILLPPTRSLVQTKRRLVSLPGGGGTPLASGLLCAMTLAQSVRKRGQTPTLVVLTDGRCNIALDGTPNRDMATQDATDIGHRIRNASIDTIVIDTGNRPEKSLKTLAQTMAGHYIPLPRADAKRLSQTVSQTLQA